MCRDCKGPLRTRREIGADLAAAPARAEKKAEEHGARRGARAVELRHSFALGVLQEITALLACELKGYCAACAVEHYARGAGRCEEIGAEGRCEREAGHPDWHRISRGGTVNEWKRGMFFMPFDPRRGVPADEADEGAAR